MMHYDLDYDSKIHHRFILQVPGKILNPIDFYYGQEYADYVTQLESHTKRVAIPQQVMERIFHLIDIIPGAHPVAGETTSNSLARL